MCAKTLQESISWGHQNHNAAVKWTLLVIDRLKPPLIKISKLDPYWYYGDDDAADKAKPWAQTNKSKASKVTNKRHKTSSTTKDSFNNEHENENPTIEQRHIQSF